MFYIDDTLYRDKWIQSKFDQFDKIDVLANSRGKRIACCLEDPAQWIVLCLYLTKKEASSFPLTPHLPYEAALRESKKGECHYLIYNGIDRIESICDRANDESSCLIQKSSGTTGEAKVIKRPWQDIEMEIENYIDAFFLSQDMTPIIACPIHHSYGLISGVLAAFKRGVTPTIISNLNPKYIIRKLSETNASLLYTSPTLLQTIAVLLPSAQKIHAAMISGSTISKRNFNTIKEKTHFFFQQYGCSEAGCISINQDATTPNSIGMPLGTFSIETGKSSNEPSEIIATINNRKIFTKDLGYKDPDGSLHYTSRMDDMINVHGIKVYPTEVENVLLEFPEIEAVVVFGKSTVNGGDSVCLNYTSKKFIPNEKIREWCLDKLSSQEIPTEIQQVKEIPTQQNGKISRQSLALLN